MNALDYLESFMRYNRQIDMLKDEIEELEHLASYGSRTTREKVQTSRDPYKATDTIVKLAEIKQQLREEIESLAIQRYDLLQTVKALPGRTGDVLYKRYLQGKEYEQISEELSYSEREIYRARKQGIASLQRILDQRERMEA